MAVVQYTCAHKQYRKRHKTNNTKNTKIHRTTQKIHRATQQLGRLWAVHRLCGFYPGIGLTTEEKHGNTSVRLLNFCRRNLFIFSKLLSDEPIFEHQPENNVEYCSNWLLWMAIMMKVSFLARRKATSV